MSTTTVTAPVTMIDFLFTGGINDATDRIAGRLHDRGLTRAALIGVRHLSSHALSSVDREVGRVADGLLGLDLGDVLVSCWRTHQALVAAARRTLAAPGSEEVVVLDRHQATARYDPTVDLLVDGVRVATVAFELLVTFEVDALEAVVRAGELVALAGGECLVTASLAMEGEPLARQQRRVDPALVVSLQPPLRLLPS